MAPLKNAMLVVKALCILIQTLHTLQSKISECFEETDAGGRGPKPEEAESQEL